METGKELLAYSIRHGQTDYTENNPDVPTEELDLTREGERTIERSILSLLPGLNPDMDVIFIVHSPRQRTQGSAAVARRVLTSAGFQMWEHPRGATHHHVPHIRAGDFVDKHGQPVYKNHPSFPEVTGKNRDWIDQVSREGRDFLQVWAMSHDPATYFEPYRDVRLRARKRLRRIHQIAHRIQPNVSKRIVVLCFEHMETMDELYTLATDHARGILQGQGVGFGEAIEIRMAAACPSPHPVRLALPHEPDVSPRVITFEQHLAD